MRSDVGTVFAAVVVVGPKTGELAGVTLLGVSTDTVRGRLLEGIDDDDDAGSVAKTRFREDVILGKAGAGTPKLPMEEALLSFLSALGVGDMGVATIVGRSVTV
mmetsp:Transcript_31740/g.76858  ORF Transcript_31740/g.76858 Transcript_31740/m.76858 type:complete len:104 (+) Transcript_31740:182-493(+)